MLTNIQGAISLATSALVGSALGKGDVDLAKRAIKVATLFNIVVVVGFSLGIQPFLPSLASVYSSNAELQDRVIENLQIYMSIVFVVDGIQIGLQGVVKGLGLQEEAQKYTGLCFFLVGLPCAYFVSSNNGLGFGEHGLWYGYLVGLVLLVTLYSRMLWNVDFTEVIKRVLEQNEEEERLANELKMLESNDNSSTSDTNFSDSLLTTSEIDRTVTTQEAHSTSEDSQISSHYGSVCRSFENQI